MPIPAGVRPIARVRAREHALDVIRDWIVSGALAPGEPVRDADIATALGLSRTPVRVALVELEREGLVDRDGSGHVRVAPIAAGDLTAILPVWIELEVLAARLAAADATDHLPALECENERLHELLGRAEHDGAPAVASEISAANDRFHLALLAAAGNRYLSEHLIDMRALLRRYENAYFSGPSGLGQLSAADHDEIVAALRHADTDTAADAMRRHLARAWDLVDRLRAGAAAD